MPEPLAVESANEEPFAAEQTEIPIAAVRAEDKRFAASLDETAMGSRMSDRGGTVGPTTMVLERAGPTSAEDAYHAAVLADDWRFVAEYDPSAEALRLAKKFAAGKHADGWCWHRHALSSNPNYKGMTGLASAMVAGGPAERSHTPDPTTLA